MPTVGWSWVDPAPADPVRFYTWPRLMNDRAALRRSQEERDRLRITVGPVQIPAGAVDAELTLRLPADR